MLVRYPTRGVKSNRNGLACVGSCAETEMELATRLSPIVHIRSQMVHRPSGRGLGEFRSRQKRQSEVTARTLNRELFELTVDRTFRSDDTGQGASEGRGVP